MESIGHRYLSGQPDSLKRAGSCCWRPALVLVLILFPLEFVSGQSGHGTDKNVLVLFSLSPSTPAYHYILEGISDQLSEHFPDRFTLHVEYLESERFPEGSYPRERFDVFNNKYRNVRVDLMICVGISISGTVRSLADHHLLGLPTIVLDYDFSPFGFPSEFTINDQTVPIRLRLDPASTIREALRLLPATRNVFFVCGVSNADQLFYSMTKQVVSMQLMKGKNVVFFTDISMDEAIRKVRRLPPHSIVFIPSFSADSRHVPYYNPEATRFISRAANAPVFTYTNMGMDNGAVGGYILVFEKAGSLAGKAAVKVLSGGSPAAFTYSPGDYYGMVYDERMLDRWNLEQDSLPEKSIILNEDLTFFGEHPWVVVLALLFLVFQTLMILALIFFYRRQRRLTLQVNKTENRYRELIREDRILHTGQLMASLSHEMNQPLTAILSTAQAGLRYVASGKYTPELLTNIFRNIVEDDQRGASILQSVRGMMKLEKREKEAVEVVAMVEEVVSMYRSEALKASIRIEPLLPDPPAFIHADRIQIQQVILNLLFNATHAVASRPVDERRIRVVVSAGPEVISFSVRDTGGGIEPAILDKLFHPFVTSRNEGLGIGLAVCKSIIEMHGGTIHAENHPAGGAVISFHLDTYHEPNN